MNYKTLELKDFIGKTLQEVKDYLEKTYPNQLLKEEDIDDFLKTNPEKYIWYYSFGSVFRGSDGRACVPFVSPRESSFVRSAGWLGIAWASNDRVVLLEDDSDPLVSLDSDALTLAIEEVKKAGYKIIKEI